MEKGNLLYASSGDHSSGTHMSPEIEAASAELERASSHYGAFASAHEGYAILLEEVDELWEEVKKNPRNRSTKRMREEAIQVAAMSLRFVRDVCSE